MQLGSSSRRGRAQLAVAGVLALSACRRSTSLFRPPATTSPVVATVRSFGASYAGVYTCMGTRLDASGATVSVQSTMSIGLDLRESWIRGAWIDMDIAMLDYRTFDTRARRWTRYLLASDGAHEALTSDGPGARSEWTWRGTQEGPTGTLQVRHHEAFARSAMEGSGEAYLGGRWTKTYEAHCRR